jgi:hypothetical protein
MGYPSMFLSVPDQRGFCFTQAFQSVGLGLAGVIGARGFLTGIAELDTVRRLGPGMLIVVYNDDAYGAEVHHFGPGGHPLDTVRFPDTDLAAIARGHGCAAITVRREDDLAPVASWLAGPSRRTDGGRPEGGRRPPLVVARGGVPRSLINGRCNRRRSAGSPR